MTKILKDKALKRGDEIMNRIGKLLPNDGFLVILNDTPPLDYVQSLTHLYQPLIGIQAISLFQTLLNETYNKRSYLQTHHTLMNYLQIPLPDLYEARLKLEGIGLLKTFKEASNDKTVYTYELQKPFTPKYFFKDAMLSQLLYHHVGELKFSQLKQQYNPSMKSIGVEVTASFTQVFQTFQPTYAVQYEQITPSNDRDHMLVAPLDFSWLEVMLKQRMIPIHNVLTTDNKRIISELTALYDLATYEVEKAVLWALTDENKLCIDEFKHACHDLFKTKRHQTPIQLQFKANEEPQSAEPTSREEQLIQQFETMSPQQLLADLSAGNQASERDMRMIRDVMLNQGLSAPVMNVLVHYVLIQSNMKLSKAYLETIASHWSRANLTTAQEAMDFAKKEIERFKNQQNKQKRSTRQQRSTEIIPDWFKDRQKERKQGRKNSEVNSTEQIHDEKEKEEFMKLLQKHSNTHNNNHVQG